MCSTPRPKRAMKLNNAGAITNGTILSGLSAQKRAVFVQRANQADDRRYELELQQKASESKHNSHIKNLSIKKTYKNQQKSWRYWLIDASLKELFLVMLLGRSY